MKPGQFRGFSLLELLAVLSIILILAALAGPNLSSILKSSELTQSEQLIIGELGLARQVALSKNRLVEVRFYRYGDPLVPGELATDPSTGKFRAIQSFEYDDEGNAQAIGKMQILPFSVILNSDKFSSLLAPSLTKQWNTTDPQPPLSMGLDYETRAFQFRPDGMTNLGKDSTSWYLTLYQATESETLEDLPANYVIIGVDPISGNAQSYRP